MFIMFNQMPIFILIVGTSLYIFFIFYICYILAFKPKVSIDSNLIGTLGMNLAKLFLIALGFLILCFLSANLFNSGYVTIAFSVIVVPVLFTIFYYILKGTNIE